MWLRFTEAEMHLKAVGHEGLQSNDLSFLLSLITYVIPFFPFLNSTLVSFLSSSLASYFLSLILFCLLLSSMYTPLHLSQTI